jgi:hypothetical protein
MRRAARTDSTQTDIVNALRRCGCRVLHLHTLGSGAPDILVGLGRRLTMMELKSGDLSPSRRRLTPLEQDFARDWAGHVITIESVDQALAWAMNKGGK